MGRASSPPCARLKAVSFAKKSASQRVTTNHPHTENNHVNSANFSVNWCGLKFIMRTIQNVCRAETELRTRVVFAELRNSVFAGISHVIDVATEEKHKLVVLGPLDKI